MPTPSSHPSAAAKMFFATQAETKASVMGAKGNVLKIEVQNNHSAAVYLQVFDKAIGSVTVGTTTADYSRLLPASTTTEIALNSGDAWRYFANDCVIAVTSTRTGNTAPGAAATVAISYKLE